MELKIRKYLIVIIILVCSVLGSVVRTNELIISHLKRLRYNQILHPYQLPYLFAGIMALGAMRC